jgi:hypothetical protein
MSERVDKQDISAGYRRIIDGSKYNKYFAAPNDVDRVIIEDGEVEQTVDLMKRVVWKYINDTKRIAPILKGSSLDETCENIWNFLYNHIQYRLDKKGLEQLRRPCRSWEERKEGIDCDCFSIFVSSILTNLGIPHSFRITKYNQGVYQHVYVIVPNGVSNITIDCVLSRYNYEKPYSQKKDFTMNMNGINVAVLSGFNGDVMDLLSGIDDNLNLSQEKKEQYLYDHLVKTRAIVAANPELILDIDYPPAFIEMLDYAIKNWNTPNRNIAIQHLTAAEAKLNQNNSIDNTDTEDDGLDELYGDFDELNGKSKSKKGFFKKVGEAVNKGGKLFVRFNPVTISARNGFLLAMKLNIKKMASKLKWAYATKEQAAAKGVSSTQWENSKKALSKIEKLFVDILQGKKSALKNAILKGKAKGINGVDEETNINGLGILPAAALAAAIPVITQALKALVDSGAMKKEEADHIEDEVKNSGTEANASASESDMSNTSTGNDTGSGSNADAGGSDGASPTSSSSGGIFGIVKDHPVIAIGGAALGIWGLTRLLKGKKPKNTGMSGVRGKHKQKNKTQQKSKNKGHSSSQKQTLKAKMLK